MHIAAYACLTQFEHAYPTFKCVLHWLHLNSTLSQRTVPVTWSCIAQVCMAKWCQCVTVLDICSLGLIMFGMVKSAHSCWRCTAEYYHVQCGGSSPCIVLLDITTNVWNCTTAVDEHAEIYVFNTLRCSSSTDIWYAEENGTLHYRVTLRAAHNLQRAHRLIAGRVTTLWVKRPLFVEWWQAMWPLCG